MMSPSSRPRCVSATARIRTDPDGDDIFARDRGQVESPPDERAPGPADVLSVDPDFRGIVDSAEDDAEPLAGRDRRD